MKANILLITDDQHRFDFFGRSGAVPALQTPHWDGLAASGAVFSRGYSNCPICIPTRFTWLYALYASQGPAGLLRNAHDWPNNYTSIAHLLQQAGYRTALIGKLHTKAGLYFRDVRADEEETRARGFDHVMEVSGKGLSNWFDCRWTEHLARKGLLEAYRARFVSFEAHFRYGERVPVEFEREDTMDGFIGAKAREYVASVPSDKPFFCHVSFCMPHFPLDPPAAYWEMYREAPMPPPEGVDDPAAIALWQQRRRAYCALIHQLDDELGALLAILEQRDLFHNTLVIYTTDHGDMMGWNNRGHKSQPYDACARTPVMMRWPGMIPAGQVIDDPMEAVDIPATIAHAAGITADIREKLPQSPGRSVLQAVCQRGAAPRRWTYSECEVGAQAWRMCYSDNWKYIARASGNDELYDLRNDPWELHNCSGDAAHAGRVSAMRRMLVESMMQSLIPDSITFDIIPDPTTARAGRAS